MPILWDRQCHLWRGDDRRDVTQFRGAGGVKTEGTELQLATAAQETRARKRAKLLLDNGKGKQHDDPISCHMAATMKGRAKNAGFTHREGEAQHPRQQELSHSSNTAGVPTPPRSCNDTGTDDSTKRVRLTTCLRCASRQSLDTTHTSRFPPVVNDFTSAGAARLKTTGTE